MNWEEMTDTQKAVLRELSDQSLLVFSRAMFRFQDGGQFAVNWHHHLICDELEKLETGDTQSLILNVSPGGSKTHLVSICFPARGLAREPKCRFLMVSYAADLVGVNSTQMRDTVKSEEYQQMWPTRIAGDSNDKKLWTILNARGKKAGGFRGASNGGAITGFRAGRLSQDAYYGTLILDDPNKPGDMLTDRKRFNSNQVWENIKTRYGSPRTPTALIQQRLHTQDATGVKLENMTCIEDGVWYKIWRNKNGSGKRWKQIIIPALITDDYVKALPVKYRKFVTGHLIEKDERGRFSYWPEKEELDTLLDIESSSPYLFKAQYQQDPVPLGGKVMPPTVWEYYVKATAPKFEFRFITGDCAFKAKETSDFTVFAVWGVANGKLYLIDYVRGRWESPKMRAQFLMLCATHKDEIAYPDDRFGTLRASYVEDAANGTGMIQELRYSAPIPINPYAPNRLGKWAACQDTLPFMNSEDSIGRIYLPEDMGHEMVNGHHTGGKLMDWVSEHAAFTSDDSHPHDDMCDNTFMAVSIGLRGQLIGNSDSSGVSVGGETGSHNF